MTATLNDPFTDTVFWLALVIRQDEHHARAQAWASRITGTITTTAAVLLETANALARPPWRSHAVKLIDHLKQRSDVVIVDLDDGLLERAWALYCGRPDKGWSWTDCVSFVVMQDRGLHAALTTDQHFQQAGFRAVLSQDPS